jgi:hypothetical protein
MTLVRRTAHCVATAAVVAILGALVGATSASAAIPTPHRAGSGTSGSLAGASAPLPADGQEEARSSTRSDLGGATAAGGGLLTAGALAVYSIRRKRYRSVLRVLTEAHDS